ncbi:glycosyltransferase [Chitinasiproducens palmae]|uniref:Glycosyl transferase family 2 n=1 Tax=Chitinasiproducens palmae TaxID=1770053 RepID=A0A1H2PP79_9BURK|nr:glycosyltransferase [Chitinasiproducens palmae]SDV48085.1 Glycosyl transferase family 2 [Chitinasiproducens palmae]
MIGIVIPAHNEEAMLPGCLAAALRAAEDAELEGEPVRILVVLDACDDGSARVCDTFGVATLAIEARNVGSARAAGAADQLQAGADWLAFTDADTVVSSGWLAAQLRHARLGADAVCGSVAVDDWSPHGVHAARLRDRFDAHYVDADGHRHIHGANLGVSAAAYRRAGGFLPLALSEDVALVDALLAAGASIAWSATPRVVTSARVDPRASGGFGDTLHAMLASVS